MTVFFFAACGDARKSSTGCRKLVELRHRRQPAASCRGFRALYFGLLDQLYRPRLGQPGHGKILGTSLNIPKFWAVVICMAITAVYTSISGLWGVLWTDLVHSF